LKRLLQRLAVQTTEGRFCYCCAVVDNDNAASARSVIDGLRANFPAPLSYAVEPTRNFALVRNRALALAQSEFIAFIDDDEVPCAEWLLRLWRTLHERRADAVLGPVKPYFEAEPPSWLRRSGVCERKSYPTGTAITWANTRTGNVLMRSSIVSQDGIWFDPAYALGGEDVDFFKRASAVGRTFVWCDEAVAYELVPEARLTRRYHLRRALLQGRISTNYVVERLSLRNRVKIAGGAFAAISIYVCALPVAFLAGEHFGMKLLIKTCHHLARLLAIFGIQHSRSRDF
jgi:GT2 family glycosyltransferase